MRVLLKHAKPEETLTPTKSKPDQVDSPKPVETSASKEGDSQKPAEQGSQATACYHGFPIGSFVRTSASRGKDKYDNQRGEVVGELTWHVKVKLVSGPAANEVRKYDPKNLKLDEAVQMEKPGLKRKASSELKDDAAERARALFSEDLGDL